MADFLFEPYAPVTIPIARGGLFAVRRVYCVGRNYAEHVVEMGNDTREPPFFFGKPADAVVVGGAAIAYPPRCAVSRLAAAAIRSACLGTARVPRRKAYAQHAG